MKHTKHYQICMMFIAICLAFGQASCDNSSSHPTTTRETTIDGAYTGSGAYGNYTITIQGSHWYGSGYVMGEYKNDAGIVRGNTLYDESGYIDMMTVSGNTIVYGPMTLRK